jgi:hypothetical protein
MEIKMNTSDSTTLSQRLMYHLMVIKMKRAEQRQFKKFLKMSKMPNASIAYSDDGLPEAHYFRKLSLGQYLKGLMNRAMWMLSHKG